MKKELFQGLSEDQIARAKACKSADELLRLAQSERIELTDEQLNAVTGGACSSTKEDNKKDNNGHRKYES